MHRESPEMIGNTSRKLPVARNTFSNNSWVALCVRRSRSFCKSLKTPKYAPRVIACSSACPKPSHSGFGFLTQTPFPLCVSQTHDPTTTTSYAPPPHSYAPCNFARHARNRATAAPFRVLGPNPLPASCSVNTVPHHHHHHLIRAIAPHPLTTLHLLF